MIITSRTPFSGAVATVNTNPGFGCLGGFGTTWSHGDSHREDYIATHYKYVWGVDIPNDIRVRIVATKWLSSASLDKEIQDPRNAPSTSRYAAAKSASDRENYIKTSYRNYWGVTIPNDIFLRIRNSSAQTNPDIDNAVANPQSDPSKSYFTQKAAADAQKAQAAADAQKAQAAQAAQQQQQQQNYTPPTPPTASSLAQLPPWALPVGIGALALVAFVFLRGNKS